MRVLSKIREAFTMEEGGCLEGLAFNKLPLLVTRKMLIEHIVDDEKRKGEEDRKMLQLGKLQ